MTSSIGQLLGSRSARRCAYAAVAVVLCSGATVACSSSGGGSASGGSDYILGGQFDLSGQSHASSTPISQGLKAAIDGINRRGGVNGHKIKLVVRDDGSDSARIASVFRELTTNNHVSAIAGLGASVESSILAPLGQRGKVALLDAGAPSSLLMPPSPAVFGTVANLALQGVAQLNYLKTLVDSGKLPAHPKIASIYYATPALTEAADQVKKYAATLGFTLVKSPSPAPNQGSMGPTMAAVGNGHADAIVSALTSTDVLAGINAASSSGITASIPWANYSYGGGPKDLKSYAAQGAAGYTNIFNFDVTGTSASGKTFATDTAADHVDATQAGVDTGYAQGLLAADVFKRCGSTCPASKFLTTLEATNDNLGGFTFAPVQFTASDHGGIRSVRFAKWDTKTSALTYVGKATAVTSP